MKAFEREKDFVFRDCVITWSKDCYRNNGWSLMSNNLSLFGKEK